ncbi:MAG TPA: ribonuclease H [Candidatus Elarobacter sp.]|nr:ribonuclease H [Candidatus Elarobacter sp.]
MPESSHADSELVAVYADESCLGNGREGNNAGGAAGVIEWQSPRTAEITRWDYWISEPATTNNRMALRSVIEAFRGISAKKKRFRVVFTTDSRYIVDGMTSWVHGWAARGWTRKSGPIENLDLWKEALRALGDHACEWRWVRGHNGQPQNEYANHLATRAASRQDSSGGLLTSGFDAWFAEHHGKGVTAQSLAPFPTHATFKGKHRVWKV